MFAGNFAPRGWALCEGQTLPISSYTALFSILGTTYGGDGRTTFMLPDLRGRSPIQQGQGPGLPQHKLGSRGGSPTNSLTVAQLPAHSHSASCSSGEGDADSPVGRVPAKQSDDNFADSGNQSMHANAIGSTGGSQPVNNMSPYLAINFIIALVGTYPSRS
jgi:microcystin-dependent protein